MRNWILSFASIFLYTVATLAAPSAQEILLKSKQASGGEAWNAIHTTHATLTLKTSGLNGNLEIWEDNLTGQSLVRYRMGPATGAEGFDGRTVWTQDASGQSTVDSGGEAVQSAANEAYRRTHAYWFPERWPAEVEYAGEELDHQQNFYVLRITPKKGRLFSLWINAETLLLDRTVEKNETDIKTSYFSDYREVNGVKIPFAERTISGDSEQDQFVTMKKIEFNQPIKDVIFRMNARPTR